MNKKNQKKNRRKKKETNSDTKHTDVLFNSFIKVSHYTYATYDILVCTYQHLRTNNENEMKKKKKKNHIQTLNIVTVFFSFYTSFLSFFFFFSQLLLTSNEIMLIFSVNKIGKMNSHINMHTQVYRGH